MNPLDFGKLIKQIDNIFIIQFKNNDLVIIQTQINDENINWVDIYRKGELMVHFTDEKISENSFTRTFTDDLLIRYYFDDNKLIYSRLLDFF